MFCGKDSKHRWFYACAVPSKGVEHEWTPKHISDQMGPAGHRRMLLRSDKEPALMAVKNRIALLLTTEYGQEIVPEESATGVSQDNGLAEHAVREVKAKVRSLAHAVKIMLGQAIEPSHPSLAWLIEWAALTMNLGRRGADGRTAYELRRGKPFRGVTAEFGERVLYLPGGKRPSRLPERFVPGCFLGLSIRTTEAYIAMEDGNVCLARSFRRLPGDQRVDRSLFFGLKAYPWHWDHRVLGGNQAGVYLDVGAGVNEGVLPPPVVAEPVAPRRAQIRAKIEFG